MVWGEFDKLYQLLMAGGSKRFGQQICRIRLRGDIMELN